MDQINQLKLEGRWKVVHKDKNGKVKSVDYIHNLITDEGINYLLNAAGHGSTVISDWYFAPFENDYTPLSSNTYAIPGYTEATTTISETLRQEWAEGASTAKSLTNAVAATITAASAVTIYGFGIVGGGSAATTKGNTAGGGTLLSSGALTAGKVLATDETLDLTYTLNAASS